MILCVICFSGCITIRSNPESRITEYILLKAEKGTFPDSIAVLPVITTDRIRNYRSVIDLPGGYGECVFREIKQETGLKLGRVLPPSRTARGLRLTGVSTASFTVEDLFEDNCRPLSCMCGMLGVEGMLIIELTDVRLYRSDSISMACEAESRVRLWSESAGVSVADYEVVSKVEMEENELLIELMSWLALNEDEPPVIPNPDYRIKAENAAMAVIGVSARDAASRLISYRKRLD